MATADALMGLGVPALVARRTSIGGTGPLTTTIEAGSTSHALALAAGDNILCNQYLVRVTSGATGTNGLALPSIGGDTGAGLADQFVVNNAVTANLVIFAPSGTTISVGGSLTSYCNVASHTTMILYPVTTTSWCAVKGS